MRTHCVPRDKWTAGTKIRLDVSDSELGRPDMRELIMISAGKRAEKERKVSAQAKITPVGGGTGLVKGRKEGGRGLAELTSSFCGPPGSFPAFLLPATSSSSSCCFTLHPLLPRVLEDGLQSVAELSDHRELTRQCQGSGLSPSVWKEDLHPMGRPTSGQSRGSHSRPLEAIKATIIYVTKTV